MIQKKAIQYLGFKKVFLIVFSFWALQSPAQYSGINEITPPPENQKYNKIHNPQGYTHEKGHIRLEKISISEHKQSQYKALYAGYSLKVNESVKTLSQVSVSQNDMVYYTLKISNHPGQSIGFIFENTHENRQNTIQIFNEKQELLWSSLNTQSQNNNPNKILSSPIMNAESFQLKYLIHDSDDASDLVLKEMIKIADPWAKQDGIGNADNCHVNINCSEGNTWQNQKRGIVRIALREGQNWFWCSGSLVNNSREDGTPYLLTADHCGAESDNNDLAVWQFYFNVEHPTCASGNNVPTDMFLSGAELRSRAPIEGGSDFKLLELSETPPSEWNVFYNGWTLSAQHSTSGASIHHPRGDAKKISTYNNYITNATYEGGMAAAYWRVFWASTVSGHGVTEGGSSGSPLFNHEGLIIGTLTGGFSSCGNTDKQDYYGKFNKHWSSNGEEPGENLSAWLDPDGEGLSSLEGFPKGSTNVFTPEQETYIKVFPQPAQDYIYIQISDFTQGKLEVSIFNLSGQLLRKKSLELRPKESLVRISINDLEKGMYIIELNNFLIHQTGKFIVN